MVEGVALLGVVSARAGPVIGAGSRTRARAAAHASPAGDGRRNFVPLMLAPARACAGTVMSLSSRSCPRLPEGCDGPRDLKGPTFHAI